MEDSFSRIPERKDADPVPSVRGAQDAPTLAGDEFLTRACEMMARLGDYVRVSDLAAALRETDRKAREDCARIADGRFRYASIVDHIYTGSVGNFIRASIKS